MLRTDRTCLNCGAEVPERYCSRCGQENKEPEETFGHLMGHFFADITHYDSKLLLTLKDLIFRPGFLTEEYHRGKRASYLNPVRMYVFISAVFFLVLFAFRTEDTSASKPSNALPGDTTESIGVAASNKGDIVITLEEHKYRNLAYYDSIQRALPPALRDGWLNHLLTRRLVQIKDEHNGQGDMVIRQNFEHNIPKVMFILMPLFAAFIGLFHLRKRFLFTQHAIFTLHFHTFAFLCFLVVLLLNEAIDNPWLLFSSSAAMILLLLIYLTSALKRVYHDPWLMAALKTVGISLLYLMTLIVSLTVGAAITYFTVS